MSEQHEEQMVRREGNRLILTLPTEQDAESLEKFLRLQLAAQMAVAKAGQ